MTEILPLMNEYAHWVSVRRLAEALYSELNAVYCQDGNLMTAVNELVYISEARVHEIGNTVRSIDRRMKE